MRGSACRYAHGQHELNAMPDLTNTALCHQMLAYGKCNDPNCHFAHSPEALRATGNFYKTTMCSFHRYGMCSLGQHCRHAHSVEELRRVPEHVDGTPSKGGTGRFSMGNVMRRRQMTNEDSGDELPDVPSWQRALTTPAGIGEHPFMLRDQAETDDELDEVPDWRRTTTVPARPYQPYQPWSRIPSRDLPPMQPGIPDSDDELGEIPSFQRAITVPSQTSTGYQMPYRSSRSKKVANAQSRSMNIMPIPGNGFEEDEMFDMNMEHLHMRQVSDGIMADPQYRRKIGAGFVNSATSTRDNSATSCDPRSPVSTPVMSPVQMAGAPLVVAPMQVMLVAPGIPTQGMPMQSRVVLPSQEAIVMKQLEAKLLESAMPEHYED